MKLSRATAATFSILAFAATAPLFASPELAVGLKEEPLPPVLAARALLALWGIFLLAAGRRFPRACVGTFLLMAALPPAWDGLAGTSIPFALFVSWIAFCLGMLVYLFVPRLAMALACSWPLAALYVLHVISSGSFSVRWWTAIALALAGGVLGAVFPKASLALLSSALGTVLLLAALIREPRFGWTAGLFAAGCLWQLAAFPLVVPRARRWDLSGRGATPGRRRLWASSCFLCLVSIAAAWAAAALFLPLPDLTHSPHPSRISALREKVSLRRPGVLLSGEDSFYLTERAFPAAALADRRGLGSRLSLFLAGRSMDRAVQSMRAVKEPEELAKLRRAAAITSRAFEEVAPLVRPGAAEGEIEKAILASFARNGATGLAFRCIVGSGANATKPHYEANSAVMEKGLVVIDIGCSFENYASDMTRTFPVAGTYTPQESQLVDLVERAHAAAREKLRAGTTLPELDRAARKVIEKAGFAKFFNHGIGHGVGLDVHDPTPGKLAPGMVVTIEPGVYIPAGSPADPKFWGLGVRIENTYIVTRDGCEQITQGPDVFVPLPPAPEAPSEGAYPPGQGTGRDGT
jgi:Xaa-Pro aminopeptidase